MLDMITDKQKEERTLTYMRYVKEQRRKLDGLETTRKMLGITDPDDWQGKLIDLSRDATLAKINRAIEAIADIDGIEGDVLRNMYVLGMSAKETAKALSYSEEWVWKAARKGRIQLYDHIPDRFKTSA